MTPAQTKLNSKGVEGQTVEATEMIYYWQLSHSSEEEKEEISDFGVEWEEGKVTVCVVVCLQVEKGERPNKQKPVKGEVEMAGQETGQIYGAPF